MGLMAVLWKGLSQSNRVNPIGAGGTMCLHFFQKDTSPRKKGPKGPNS